MVAALLTFLVGGALAVDHVRDVDAAATAAERREARAELAADLGDVRTAIATPARAGQQAASALLRHELRLVAGDAPDPQVGDDLVADLRGAADELDEAADTPLPERPTTLPVATVDPIFARLTGLEEQAAELATRFSDAADAAATRLAALRELDEAALAYAASSEQLPSSDDPGVVADAWRAEQDRLTTYAAAVDAAAERPEVAPLAEAHDQLVGGMRQLADDAVDRLEDGDVDGYVSVLADRLEVDDPFGFTAALDAARTEVAERAVDGPLEQVRARALGLLTELEELRRVTPAQLAEVG